MERKAEKEGKSVEQVASENAMKIAEAKARNNGMSLLIAHAVYRVCK